MPGDAAGTAKNAAPARWKPPSAMITNGEPIILPEISKRVDHRS